MNVLSTVGSGGLRAGVVGLNDEPATPEQLEEMKQIYGAMLRQLPSKTEMPELLVDVSQSALASGLETELFQPGAEILKDFFAEQPIALRMTGDYHSFGTFISTVAALPRIIILTSSGPHPG